MAKKSAEEAALEKVEEAITKLPASAPLGAMDKLEEIINKSFGTDSIFMPKKKMPIFKLDRISTGNMFLDLDLGGGLATGRIHLITGQFSSGKTFLAMKIAAQFTKKKQRVCIIDAEFTFDPSWAVACGVDMDYVYVVAKQEQETVIDIVELLVASGEFALVILDSLAALIPTKLKEEQADKAEMGRSAYLNNRMFKKILAQQSDAALAGKQVATLIVINQWRKKVNAMGNPNILPGGEGQYYYCSTWIDFWAEETILDGKEKVVGMKFGYHTRKNKTAPPRKQGLVSMFMEPYNGMSKGDWDSLGAVIDVATITGVFKKSGTWYSSPLLDKSYQFSNLWKGIYGDKDLEMKIVKAIGERLPEMDFRYQPQERRIEKVKDAEVEVKNVDEAAQVG